MNHKQKETIKKAKKVEVEYKQELNNFFHKSVEINNQVRTEVEMLKAQVAECRSHLIPGKLYTLPKSIELALPDRVVGHMVDYVRCEDVFDQDMFVPMRKMLIMGINSTNLAMFVELHPVRVTINSLLTGRTPRLVAKLATALVDLSYSRSHSNNNAMTDSLLEECELTKSMLLEEITLDLVPVFFIQNAKYTVISNTYPYLEEFYKGCHSYDDASDEQQTQYLIPSEIEDPNFFDSRKLEKI